MSLSFRLAKNACVASLLSVFASLFFTSIAFASDITYTGDTTIEFGSLNLVISAGSTASSVTINTSTINVVTGVGDEFTITSPAFYQITSSPEQTTTCTASLSRVVVAASQTVTITPTTTPCPVASGGSSAPRSEPQPPYVEPAPVVSTPVTSTAVATETPVVITPVTTIEYFSDLVSLTTKQRADVLALTDYLIDHKTVFPIEVTKKYYPNHILTYGYAIQVANSFSPLGCGSNDYLGIHSCKDHAVKMGYVSSSRSVNARIKRIDFYRLLLKTIGKKILTKKNAIAQVQKYCSDAQDISESEANLYLTARQYNIVTRFKSGKCQLDLYLPRIEAASIGARMMTR